jgi:hypothetical protein
MVTQETKEFLNGFIVLRQSCVKKINGVDGGIILVGLHIRTRHPKRRVLEPSATLHSAQVVQGAVSNFGAPASVVDQR